MDHLITMYIYIVTSFRPKHFFIVFLHTLFPFRVLSLFFQRLRRQIWTLIGCLFLIFSVFSGVFCILISFCLIFMSSCCLLHLTFWESFYFYNLYWISISQSYFNFQDLFLVLFLLNSILSLFLKAWFLLTFFWGYYLQIFPQVLFLFPELLLFPLEPVSLFVWLFCSCCNLRQLSGNPWISVLV